MKKVIWGVLSTANIAIKKVIPAMQQSSWCEIRAIASRSADKAHKAADTLGITHAYGSYQELLADSEIEAIYNPLPNHLHVPLTLQAAAAGKHVLCEKPIALNHHEAEQLLAAANKVKIMEAFMVRFHPQWQRVRELISSGHIGTPRAVQVFFSFFNDNPRDVRNQAMIGGGALYDIGCYAILAGRFMFAAKAKRAIALIDRDPNFGIDRTSSGIVDFGEGRQLSFTVSTQADNYQLMQVHGSKGRIELAIPFNPQSETRILIADHETQIGDPLKVEIIPKCDQYTLQGEAFSRAIRGEIELPYDVNDAIQNMRIIDALFRSEQSGTWETC
ncbi:MAG: Gfo/Idh/MocA family oxidoreductase [Deltaproteobacteria bacterium]|nr:Gfo/Idh/MocA family oxidoreductase [Deltaproteobacteria bacterium]